MYMGLSGCSLLGDSAADRQTNLANQRTVALQLVKDYPNPELESIRFTQEGSVGGSGEWAANATITVAGTDYDSILGTSMSIGEPLPPIAQGSTLTQVAVIYSNGTSEALG